MHKRNKDNPNRGRRGVTLLESALVTAAMLSLLFLTFDYAFAIFLKATFEHAAREGARYAITYQTSGGLGQDASIKKRVVDSSLGFLKAENVTVEYFDPSSPNPTTAIPPPNGNDPDNIVTVSIVGYRWNYLFPTRFFSGRSQASLVVNASAADRMEQRGSGAKVPR